MSPSLTALTAQTQFSNDSVWIADSGASQHMVQNVSQLDSVIPCSTTDQVTVSNGAGLPIAHVGHAHPHSASSDLHLKNVFHVPHLTANLLSVHTIMRVLSFFYQSGFCIQDKATKKVLLQGKSRDGLYPISSGTSKNFKFSSPAMLAKQ